MTHRDAHMDAMLRHLGAVYKERPDMTHRDVHLDAMLRHLGAAYYESLHGRASAADVARARAAIEEHMAEQPPAPGRAMAGTREERRRPKRITMAAGTAPSGT